MANEIQVNVSLIVNKGSLQYSQVPGSLLFDMTGTTSAGGAAAATTTAAAIDINTLTATTVGYAYFRNTDATNTILVGTGTSGSFVQFLELRPREVAVLRLASNGSGTTPTMKSTAGTPVLQYWIAAT